MLNPPEWDRILANMESLRDLMQGVPTPAAREAQEDAALRGVSDRSIRREATAVALLASLGKAGLEDTNRARLVERVVALADALIVELDNVAMDDLKRTLAKLSR